MNIWLITDTHFGHKKLVFDGHRPSEYDSMLATSMMRELTANAVLIHLGDICIGEDAAWHSLIERLPCRKWLVKGNHDRKSDNWYLNHGWDFVSAQFRGYYFGYDILFSHVPQPDYGYDFNIHGHFHDSDHRRHEPYLVSIANPKQKLLAVEHTNYHPVKLQTFLEMIVTHEE